MKFSVLIIFVGFAVNFATEVDANSSQRKLETSEDTVSDSSIETNGTSNEGTDSDTSTNDESVSTTVRSTMLSILDDTRNSLLAFYYDDDIVLSDDKKAKRDTAVNDNKGPTRSPIKFRSRPPSKKPTRVPTGVPSLPPNSVPPSTQPAAPTLSPKANPSRAPTRLPTSIPTRLPTDARTPAPTRLPTLVPTPLSKPTSFPTSKPTGKPTNLPTIQPNLPTNRAPTRRPTISPTSLPSKTSTTRSPIIAPSLDAVIEQAKLKIRETIMINPFIAANYVRLGFHDCVPNGAAGGCDGCLNLISNDENAGLQPSVDALAPIAAELEPLGLSRADIWALAVLVAADVSQSEIIFSDAFEPGRVNCEIAGTCQFSGSDDPTLSALCSTHGPDTPADFPSTIFTTHELISFMGNHFGFNADQTVAIMGAHTLGRAMPENSGYEGRNGWVLNHTVLDNDYYKLLAGSPDLAMDAPDWKQIQLPNGLVQWIHTPTDVFPPKQLFMLNVDISFARDLAGFGFLPTCTFHAPQRCPLADTLTKAGAYGQNNLEWLNDFKSVLIIMLDKGRVIV